MMDSLKQMAVVALATIIVVVGWSEIQGWPSNLHWLVCAVTGK